MEGLRIDQTLLDCIIQGTQTGMEMAGIKPEAVGASRFSNVQRELSVLVGLHGQRNGNLTINLSQNTATFLAAQLLGEERTEMNDDTIDAICELGNIVAGRCKDLLKDGPYEFDAISLPALIFGASYNVYHLKNIISVSVVFEIEEVSMIHIEDKFFATSIALLGTSGSAKLHA